MHVITWLKLQLCAITRRIEVLKTEEGSKVADDDGSLRVGAGQSPELVSSIYFNLI